MKILIDTSIFISAALFPKGRAAEALHKALTSPYQPGNNNNSDVKQMTNA